MQARIGRALYLLAALWLTVYAASLGWAALPLSYELLLGLIWGTALLFLGALILKTAAGGRVCRCLRDAPLMWARIGGRSGVVLVVLGGVMGTACTAVSIPPEPQDACRIGEVSSEQYQSIAAEIAVLPPIDWDAALAAGRYPRDGVEVALRERLEQVLADRPSADEQTAAMHALMRSFGAELATATRGRSDPVTATYRYRLDVNHIGMIRFLVRWAAIVIKVEGRSDLGKGMTLDRVVALMPEMWEPGRPGYVKPLQWELCPPQPSDAPTFQERQERYNQRH